jgi:hypothetical protein
MVFTTSTADTGIEVHSIDRVMHDNEVLPNNTYANGYHFRFYVTLNAMEERNLQFKLNNRSRVDGEIMQVANNTKV